MQETQETQVRYLGQEDPLEKEMAHPLQYFCQENPMDRGTSWGLQGVTLLSTPAFFNQQFLVFCML